MIKIGKDYHIDVIPDNYVLYRKSKIIGYYSDLNQALKALLKYGLMGTELKDLRTILMKMEEIEKNIDNMLNGRE
jgi:hypothetical protein